MNNVNCLAVALTLLFVAAPALADTPSSVHTQVAAASAGFVGGTTAQGSHTLTPRQQHLNKVLDPYDGDAAPLT